LFFSRELALFRPIRMTSAIHNAQAMIIGMIIIRRRLGHGHVA